MRQHSGIGVLDKAMGVLHAVAEQPCSLTELCNRTGSPAPPHTVSPWDSKCTDSHSRRGRTVVHRTGLGELAATASDTLVDAAALVLPRAPRDHRRKRSALPARGDPPGVHRVDGAARRPARHGARRRATADDRRFGRQGPSRMGGRPDPRAILPEASFGERVLVEVRRRGWRRARRTRVRRGSVAAPVRDASGNVVAAISVSGPIDRMGRRPGARWAADLLAAADALHKRL